MLRISQLAEQTGLSAHTLRFYEKHGLLQASERSDAGYRLYDDGDLRKAQFIRTARNTGFSLEDIAALLAIRVDRSQHSCQEVTEITERKLQEVNHKIAELKSMQATLQRLLDSCCGGPETAVHCSIMEALDTRAARTRESQK